MNGTSHLHRCLPDSFHVVNKSSSLSGGLNMHMPSHRLSFLNYLSLYLAFDLFNVEPVRVQAMRVIQIKLTGLKIVGLNGSKRDCFTRKGAVQILTKTRTTIPNRSRTIIPNKAISDYVPSTKSEIRHSPF
jgi:hypothetical protein